MLAENVNKDGYFMKKNLLLKITAVIILIQGALQLFNVVLILSQGAKTDKISFAMFYLSLGLMAVYGAAAVAGGYIGLRYDRERNGCRKAFYFGLILVILNLIMMVINIFAGAFQVNQLASFIIPGLFTASAVYSGRSC